MSDSSFDAGWLALREPVDHRSRDERLTSRVASEGGRRGWSRALDLGTGTGSNLRYLDPRLPWVREWSAVDHDEALLARVPEPPGNRVLRRIPGDLSREGIEAIGEADLVTASALLDLVSSAWVERLVEACRAVGAGGLFALSYDGTFAWDPEKPDDRAILAAVNRHQERDKGLGEALGPAAAGFTEAAFREAGYHTERTPSPWILEGSVDAALAWELTLGWARAAGEVDGVGEDRVRRWLERCRERIEGGRFRLNVGHWDLLALPPSRVG